MDSDSLISNSTESAQVNYEVGGFKQKTAMTLLIYFGVQAIIGIISIEYAWARTKRFREVDEQRDAMFPQFRRTDAKNWARWKFYPGAMFLMPTRLILLFLDGIFLTAIIK